MTTWQDIKPTLKFDSAERANIEKLTELSTLRISNNIPLTALAGQIGISQATLNSWESLDETPTPELLSCYEQGLKLLLNWK